MTTKEAAAYCSDVVIMLTISGFFIQARAVQLGIKALEEKFTQEKGK